MNMGQGSCCLQQCPSCFLFSERMGRRKISGLCYANSELICEEMQLGVWSWESHCWIVQREQIWSEMQALMLRGRQITYPIFQCISTVSLVPRWLLHLEELQPALVETSRCTARLTWLAAGFSWDTRVSERVCKQRLYLMNGVFGF